MKSLNLIQNFIRRHHVMHMAVVDGERPWSATCWYVFDDESMHLIFASQRKSKHIQCILKNNNVSVTISNQTKIWRHIQGVQITGKVVHADISEYPEYHKRYRNTFYISKFIQFDLWFIEIEYVKFTKNLNFFGQKIYWKR